MSLQDQLLKAGLVDKKKAQNLKKQKHKARKQHTGADAEAEKRAEQARTEKAARDRELNRQRQQEAEKRASEAQVRQMIEDHCLTDSNGETAYNFVDGKLVKRLYIAAELVDPLSRGKLAIVRRESGYALIPVAVAEKIRQRQPDAIVVLNEGKDEPDEDDPYADFQVPDDLMW